MAVLLLAWHALREHVAAGAPESIEIDYVGNPNGVYHARCSRVNTPPGGHIVDLEAGETIVDATSEYLPDGVKLHGPGNRTTSYDCHDYLVDTGAGTAPAIVPATDAPASDTPSLDTPTSSTTSTTAVIPGTP